MSNLNPEGSCGVLLKLNVTYSTLYADIIGLRLDFLNKFNINVHCLIRQKINCIVKFEFVLKSLAMIFFPILNFSF